LNTGALDYARAVLARYGHQPAPPADGEVEELVRWLRQQGVTEATRLLYTRAAYLLEQRHPAPPAEGEVGVLLRELRDAAFDLNGSDPAKSMLTRAADLLSIAYATGPEVWEPIPLLPAQRHPTPVPVAERLPGAEDCDAEGRCWVHQPHEACPESPAWELMLAKYASANYEAVCWLPANALPLPSGEVE